MSKIDELINLYNHLVILDHHKEKDCHWYIEKTWSYGQSPVYVVKHYGYLYNGLREPVTCSTMEEAENVLTMHLNAAIMESISCAKDVMKCQYDYDDSTVNQASRVLELVDSWIKEQ